PPGTGVGVPVEVGDGIGVGLDGTVAVAVGVGVRVAVGVAVGVGVGLRVAVGVGVVGPDCTQYLPPVFTHREPSPPQTIISLPVQTDVGYPRPSGTLKVLVAVQLSVPGMYRPPVLKELLAPHPLIWMTFLTAESREGSPRAPVMRVVDQDL